MYWFAIYNFAMKMSKNENRAIHALSFGKIFRILLKAELFY